MIFGFGLHPGVPPRTVLGMILCVVTAAATMQAAGGLDYLVIIADRALRIWPAGITIVAPIVTYVFTLAAGTGHIVYALLPVIAEVSRSAGVRPERPLSIATIASQQAITASPISAATVALLGLLSPSGIGLHQILLICIPSTLLGSLLGAVSVMWMGPDLKDDPEYQERLAKGLVEKPVALTTLQGKALTCARGSVIVFLIAALLVVALGLFPSLRPDYTSIINGQEREQQLEMAPAIMIIMLAAAGVMMLAFKASPSAAIKGTIMNAGVVALISIAGLGWLGSSFFEGNRQLIIASISGVVQAHPWVFAFGLFALSILLASQAATVVNPDAGRRGFGLGRAHDDCHVPSSERVLFPADLCHTAGGDLLRPNRHNEDRQIRTEPQLHASRSNGDCLVRADWICVGQVCALEATSRAIAEPCSEATTAILRPAAYIIRHQPPARLG
jgi:anaerobic C4-dicarboxylate transporter-like protein